MKNLISKRTKKVIITVFLFFLPILFSISQPVNRPPDPGGAPSGDPLQHHPKAPIDGGLGVILILSAGYGLSKIYKIRKKVKR